MSTSLIHPAELHVLLALGDGPKHGHGIKLDVRARTHGKTDMGPGTLYGAIKRLSERGWIKEVDREERRRFYDITPEGEVMLRAELSRLRELLGIAAAKSLVPPK